MGRSAKSVVDSAALGGLGVTLLAACPTRVQGCMDDIGFEGCCQVDGTNWYCTESGTYFMEECG